MTGITAVIFDLAGTTVDHGSLAPVRALQKLLGSHGMAISAEEARRDMGIPKKEHIRALLEHKIGSPPAEAELLRLFAEFVPIQMECLAEYSGVIRGVPDVIARLRSRGIRIGSTTGYTRPMLDLVLTRAAKEGYAPDCALCPEDAGAGRPFPWMCYLGAIRLRSYPMHTMVKIGDTISDIQEGLNARMWTVAVARTGNMIGMAEREFDGLPAAEQESRLRAARRKLESAGAHYVIDSAAGCEPVLAHIGERIAKGERP